MTAQRNRFPRPGVVAVVTTVAAILVGAVMAQRSLAIDPWTAVLTGLVAIALVAAGAAGLLRAPRRLDPLFDEVDRQTGAGNAQAALSLLDRELERADVVGSIFSLAVVELDHALFDGMANRRAARTVGELVRGVVRDARLGDQVCRVAAADREMMLVVMPDTGGYGAHTFADRLLMRSQRHLVEQRIPFDGHVRAEVLTYPNDVEELRRLKRRLEVLDGVDALIRDVAVRGPRRRRESQEIQLAVRRDDASVPLG